MSNDTQTQKERQLRWRGVQTVGHKPVDEGRLHAQTVNNEVAEDELVELNIANETCRVSQGFFKAFPLRSQDAVNRCLWWEDKDQWAQAAAG